MYVVLVCVLACIVFVPGAIAGARGSSADAAQESAQAQAAEAEAKDAKAASDADEAKRSKADDFELSAATFDDIPTSDGLVSYSLAGLDAPKVSSAHRASVESAIAAIEEQGSVSMVLVDAQTGSGLAYQPDLVVYGASSFKALYSMYVCESLVEKGEVSLDDYCAVNWVADSSGGYSGGSYPVYELIEAAVIYSNNNAYGALRDAFDFEGFDDWVTGLGANDAVYREDSWFPTYAARSSARLWSEMLAYVGEGSETAQWLWDLTGQTTVSFIRDGLEGLDAVVHNKAGWCSDSDPSYNSVSDAGVVDLDGRTYIMSIMTGMPDTDSNRALVGQLARALADCCGDLVPSGSDDD